MRSQNGMSDLSHKTPWWGLVRVLRAAICSCWPEPRERRYRPERTTCADLDQNGAQSTVLLVEQRFTRPRNRVGRCCDKAERSAAFGS